MNKKSVVLLSGGLDSSTTLYLAKKKGFDCYCLCADYGQRHKKELIAAKRIAKKAGAKLKIIKFKLPHQSSSLLNRNEALPKRSLEKIMPGEIPSTYVPARNTIFISFALSYAEAINAEAIFIGANALDYSGYPDCRPQYYRAFNKLIGKGLKNNYINIHTPLINKTKADIVRLALKLKVPFELTWSCYQGSKDPCGVCDSCLLRAKGFKEAGIRDYSLN